MAQISRMTQIRPKTIKTEDNHAKIKSCFASLFISVICEIRDICGRFLLRVLELQNSPGWFPALRFEIRLGFGS